MSARAVALDLGNVLIDYEPEATARAIAAAAGIPLAEAIRGVEAAIAAGLKRDLEAGALAPRAFWRRFLAFVPPLSYESFCACWCAAVRPRPAASSLLLGRLRPGVRLAVWSNTDPIHFGFVAPRVTLFARAAAHLSFLAGARKPHPAFYVAALRQLGARPEETLFLDDAEENVAAARALGIEAERVASVAELAAALARHGLIA